MSLAKNNRLGAGDGITLQLQARKRRVQVASSRKFATRGAAVLPNADIKQQLQNALSELRTLPESPLKRRSLSLAEITHTNIYNNGKKSLDGERLAPAAHLELKETVALVPVAAVTAAAAAAGEEKARRADAGRRVCHQLVLNAWRRRRSELASAVESRDRIQSQVDQLNLQVGFLQKMRTFEVERRGATLDENKDLVAKLEEAQKTSSHIEQRISSLMEQIVSSENNAANLHVALMNERNLNSSLRLDIEHLNQELQKGQKQVETLTQEVQQHLKQIMKFQTLQSQHNASCQQYEATISKAEDKHLELLQNFQTLQANCSDLQQQNGDITKEKQRLNELLISTRNKNDKLEHKLSDIKKQLTAKLYQKTLDNEAIDILCGEVARLKTEQQAEQDRQWWLKTGEFLFDKFKYCAYIVFPALPTKDVLKSLLVVDNSIALGSL